ncbi:Phytanoyl-CoA dioxygenase (PhyH) [Stieleria maiorica]|uniref:Phytanoyl-CoA dioxygenase (PhyH) n=1 Tax=Stieleria maiorica TaxID=2795974 RepID=A0A5B9MJ26_9BACT|nr:phytanoyl-CoA dioxygenase family protein [Stieleria maiorica]QEG00450.1 Phytanoyl-CoA dioxygenase (PhyH) [Stieleria maiorica]
MNDWHLERDGFCLLKSAVPAKTITGLIDACRQAFDDDTRGVRARSSRGHVYAARNLIDSIAEVKTVWRDDPMRSFLNEQLGADFGLVRALFFDKPPDRTWGLAWHKDTSIAVQDNSITSTSFSRPTTKAGVPHVIACDDVLKQLLTLRIHLDEVSGENGPLRVIPGSHRSSGSEGEGLGAAVDIHAAPGDVLAMRPLISHSSGPSHPGTTRHRRILHLEFAASATLPDGMQWHDFVRGD